MLIRLFSPETYYSYDTALMFQHTVESAVQEVIEGITKPRGIRALTELEKKPVMKELVSRSM